jgi:hypothetical protein
MWFRVLREGVSEYKSGSFSCTKCKVEVISWIGVFAYSNWTEVGRPMAETKQFPTRSRLSSTTLPQHPAEESVGPSPGFWRSFEPLGLTA